MRFLLLPSDAQGVGYAVYVVEPGGDQRDLQDCFVVESGGSQALVVVLPYLSRVPGKFDYVVEHHSLLPGYGCGGVVLLQCFDEGFIQGDATQKLCVGVDSIDAAVGDGDHGSDQFVLAAVERQVRGHEDAEGGEGVVERVGNQAVGGDDLGAPALDRMHGRGVLLGVEAFLIFHGLAQFCVGFGERDGADPGHRKQSTAEEL